ncbi:MAG: hypothetical protein ACXWV9_00130 [Flavisolibacter sp.]
MSEKVKRRSIKKILIIIASGLTLLILSLIIFVNSYVEPLMRNRLKTLVIAGSDSLYTYSLGSLNASFYGGNVEVENLHITVDSTRFHYLHKRHSLPSLTMQLSLKKGQVKGINLFDLLFRKRISINEIMSSQADINLSRHLRPSDSIENDPLWKSIQPDISAISVEKISLNGVKLLYKNADTSESIKLQFDRCDAAFENVLIDSASAMDTSRMAFSKDVSFRFHDLKFRTADSSYKMKAEWINYSSRSNLLEIDRFKLQPTLEKEDFYKKTGLQQGLYYVEFAKVRFVNTMLDRFIHNDIINADSLIFEGADISVYQDKSAPIPDYESKIGKFPHQLLLKATTGVTIKNISMPDAKIQYTQKNEKTLQEGVVKIEKVNLRMKHVTNDPQLIQQNPVSTSEVNGNILGGSPFSVAFKFYLDSMNGKYEADGWVKNISSQQLNAIAKPLANINLNSFKIHELTFNVKGEDYIAASNVRMKYNDLSVTLFKTDEETGKTTRRNFITKVVNRYVVFSDNPEGGRERISNNKTVHRLTMHSFFGQLWKSVFAGMQVIMMKNQ